MLTPNAEKLCQKRFAEVQLEDYEIDTHNYDDVHECNIRNRSGGLAVTVVIPTKTDAHGSRFGTCTCGIHKTKTIPCVHMIAVTMSSEIEGLNCVNITPSWC